MIACKWKWRSSTRSSCYKCLLRFIHQRNDEKVKSDKCVYPLNTRSFVCDMSPSLLSSFFSYLNLPTQPNSKKYIEKHSIEINNKLTFLHWSEASKHDLHTYLLTCCGFVIRLLIDININNLHYRFENHRFEN